MHARIVSFWALERSTRVSRGKRAIDVFGVAAAVVLAATVLGIGASVLAASVRWSVTATIAVTVTAVPFIVSRYARRALGVRGPIYAALAGSVVAPFVFLGAASVLSEPILHDFRCGFGLLGVAMLGTPLATATWLAARSERIDRALRVLTIAAVAGAAILVLLAAARRAHRPDADGYIARLPVVAELDAGGFREIDLAELKVDDKFSGPPFTRAFRVDIPGGPSIYRACRDGGECRLWTRGRADSVARASISWSRTDSPITVRRDEAHDLYVLDGAAPRLAVYGDGRARMPLYPRDVRDGLAAPNAWILCAALGTALACALLLQGRARERHAASVAWREGFSAGAGTLVFADGASVALGAPLPEGTPVTVSSAALDPTTFRTVPSLSERDLRPGTLADRAMEARAVGTAAAARALVVIALTSAPLVACIVHGVAF